MITHKIKNEDIVIKVLHDLHKQGNKRIRYDHKIIHKIFLDIKNIYDSLNIQHDLLFRDNNVYQICDDVDRILDELSLVGYINRYNGYLHINKNILEDINVNN